MSSQQLLALAMGLGIGLVIDQMLRLPKIRLRLNIGSAGGGHERSHAAAGATADETRRPLRMPGRLAEAGSRTRGNGVQKRKSGAAGQSVVEFALVLPIMLVLLLGIVDLARIYTTMLSVESAAREAADYGTTLGASKWQVGAVLDATVAEMRRRSCIAARNLPDYVGPDNGCTNPSFAYCVTSSSGGTCGPVDEADGCDVPTRTEPCRVTVTLTYQFHLIAPLQLDVGGGTFGLPATLTFARDSTFAMTDIDLSSPAP